MAPNENDMSQEQLLDEHGKRLSTHGERLNRHDKRIDEHEQRLSTFDLSLFGDAKLNIKGLVESMSEMNAALKDLLAWRDQIVIYFRAARIAVRLGLILLGVIAAGEWLPYIQALLKALGG